METVSIHILRIFLVQVYVSHYDSLDIKYFIYISL